MAYHNQLTLIGNLGADPETRHTAKGVPVSQFSIASTKRWRKDDETHERTVWHRVIVFSGTANFVADYLHKGDLVSVSGESINRSYESDGQTRYVHEVHARSVQLLSKKSSSSSPDEADIESSVLEEEDVEDDIPF